MAKHERQAGSADALLLLFHHQHSDAPPCIPQALHFRSQLQHPVKWWRYSHDSRLVLLGTGELGLWLQVSYSFPGQTTVFSEWCMMGPFWASCHTTALEMCISV